MATDPDPALRAELNAALGDLLPAIRGLRNTANDPLSAAALAVVTADIATLKRRYDKIIAVLKRLDAQQASAQAAEDATAAAVEDLAADGYPALPEPVVPVEIFDELERVRADDNAGLDRFNESTAATKIVFAPPVTKDKPVNQGD